MRARAREDRLHQSDRLRAEAAQALAAHTLALPAVQSAQCVSVYASRPSEPGTLPLIAALADRGVRVLIPRLGRRPQTGLGRVPRRDGPHGARAGPPARAIGAVPPAGGSRRRRRGRHARARRRSDGHAPRRGRRLVRPVPARRAKRRPDSGVLLPRRGARLGPPRSTRGTRRPRPRRRHAGRRHALRPPGGDVRYPACPGTTTPATSVTTASRRCTPSRAKRSPCARSAAARSAA